MDKTAIIIIPYLSSETLVSHSVGIEVANYFRSRGIKYLCLSGIFTIRPIVTRIMQHIRNTETPPHLLMYFGHGEKDNLIGSERPNIRFKSLRPITEDNVEILKDCIVYTVACNSRVSLGEKAILKGAICYYGTTIPLDVLMKDEFKLFIDVFSEVPKRLADGYTTYDAYNSFDNKIRECIHDVESGSDDENALIRIIGNYDIIGSNVKWLDSII